jgi:hypothetical protein
MPSRHAGRHSSVHSIAIALAPAGGANGPRRTAPTRRGLVSASHRRAVLSRVVGLPVAVRRGRQRVYPRRFDGLTQARDGIASDDPSAVFPTKVSRSKAGLSCQVAMMRSASGLRSPSAIDRAAPIKGARPPSSRRVIELAGVGAAGTEFEVAITHEERSPCDRGRPVATTQTKPRPPRRASAITQAALRVALSATDTDRWVDRLERLPSHDLSHDSVVRALDAARDGSGS